MRTFVLAYLALLLPNTCPIFPAIVANINWSAPYFSFGKEVNTPIHPPLGVFSIDIRVYSPNIKFNHLGVRSWLANLDLHLHNIVYTLMDYLAPPMFDVSNIYMEA